MISELKEKVLAGESINQEEAVALSRLPEAKTMELLAAANEIKEKYQGKKVDLCSIVNAKSGSCSEDCAFCAQSLHYNTKSINYSLLNKEEILERAKDLQRRGAKRFSIVTSGKGAVNDKDFNKILDIIKRIKEETSLEVCASLGLLTEEDINALIKAGLTRYHHNLETSKSYFSKMCTTHSYEQRVETIRALKEHKIDVCAGGIIGLGEGYKERIELIFDLKALDVNSIPVNILNPVAGTPLEASKSLAPMEVLKTVAIFRFVLPTKVIRLCGGREKNLRNLQSLSLVSGVNGLMVGNYLTTKGRSVAEDIQMINDLGLEI